MEIQAHDKDWTEKCVKLILHYRKSTDVWTIEGGAYTIESSSTANDDIIYERTDKEECFYSEVNHALKNTQRFSSFHNFDDEMPNK